MPCLSVMRAPVTAGARLAISAAKGAPKLAAPVRSMGGHGFNIRPSRFEYSRVKDEMHLFILLPAIPLGAFILYCNLFIGPAELREIPEGYVPEPYEYVQHPISRWLAKHMDGYEKVYERNAYYIWKQNELNKANKLTKKYVFLMGENQDERNWYFVPSKNIEEVEYAAKMRGEW